MTVGEMIKSQRIAYGLSQKELGEELGVREELIAKWERGYVESMPLSKLKVMANLFKIAPTYLIETEERNDK